MEFEEKDLAVFAENDLKELLDTDSYAEALRIAGELDLSSLIENSFNGGSSGVVLNDRLITEASLGIISQLGSLTPLSSLFNNGAKPPSTIPIIKDEHSYSLSDEPPAKAIEEDLSDIESECYPAISIAEAEGSRTHIKKEVLTKIEISDKGRDEEVGISDLITFPGVENLPFVGFSSEANNEKEEEEEEEEEERAEEEENWEEKPEADRRSTSSLQRHASTETLSCCWDCDNCQIDEDADFEESPLLPSSPFSLFEFSQREDEHDPEENVTLGSRHERRTGQQQSQHQPYPKVQISSPSLTIITTDSSQDQRERQTCVTNANKPPAGTIVVTHSNTHSLNTVHRPAFAQGKHDKNSAPNDTEDKVSGPAVNQQSVISKYRESGFVYPPTPPSCSGSDSESGGQSPNRTSPLYERVSLPLCNAKKSSSPGKISTRNPIHTHLISSQPKGATGTLHLTEEEKRTLISEGYSVPSKLPLTKAEEKSLKKIRRKIKNKISAQESRRKKKEYMDTLEHKVDLLSQENGTYRRKIESLQYRNKQLLQELDRLQDLVNKDEKNRVRSTPRAMILT